MIIKKEWKSYVKTLLVWICCVAGLDFIMILFFPGLEETMKEAASMYQSMGAFGTAFGVDQLNVGNATGFYGAYVGAILSLGGAMFAALIGVGILAKEENGHTAEYLFTLPYSRKNIVINKMVSMVLVILVFDVANIVMGLLGLQIIGREYQMKGILLFHVAQVIMHLEVGAIAFLISACSKRINTGVALGMALLFYFMDMMSRVLDQLKFCKYITPFYYSNSADIFANEKIDVGLLLLGVGVMVACFVAGIYVYDKKDLAA